MRYHALACDYDGTIAAQGRVAPSTFAALDRLRRSGRRVVLVTGRRLDDLQRVCPEVERFDRIVAENGAVVHDPASRGGSVLAEPPPERFLEALRRRGVAPLVAGRVIVATREPHETAVVETIRDLGLELQVIFNKGAVMVLPSGVNKATGLAAALRELGLSPHNVVGVGDAENDHAFLALCECSAAVADALPMVREKADLVLPRDDGQGVEDLIAGLLETDLEELSPRLVRHEIPLGRRIDAAGDAEGGDAEVRVEPHGTNVLVCGTSGSGKSTLAQGFLERLAERRRQFCVVDPEGDYEALEGAVALGDGRREPSIEEVRHALEDPERSTIASLLGLRLEDRPRYFERLLGALLDLRGRTGRPHWLVFDEAHHLMPRGWRPPESLAALQGALLITVHPGEVSAAIMKTIDLVVAVGPTAPRVLEEFAANAALSKPRIRGGAPGPGEALAWRPRRRGAAPFRFAVLPPSAERRRHQRKYVEGELGPDRSFYFRGPQGRLNLRVQNLSLFTRIAEGVDDETWTWHLRRGDYSRWFRAAIKDEDLAAEAEAIERDEAPAGRSRERMRAAIEARYTAPA